MTYARNAIIIFWCLLCGLLFFFGFYKVAFSSPYFFIVALFFYIIGVPPIYLLDKSNGDSKVKYNILKFISFLTLYLMIMIDPFRIFPVNLNLIAPFFVFYISIGFWALLSVWFFIVSVRYGGTSRIAKIYALTSLVIINGSGLLFSIMVDYAVITKK